MGIDSRGGTTATEIKRPNRMAIQFTSEACLLRPAITIFTEADG